MTENVPKKSHFLEQYYSRPWVHFRDIMIFNYVFLLPGDVPPTRWIMNFDKDLLDGLVLAAQMAAYCPYLVSTSLLLMSTTIHIEITINSYIYLSFSAGFFPFHRHVYQPRISWTMLSQLPDLDECPPNNQLKYWHTGENIFTICKMKCIYF